MRNYIINFQSTHTQKKIFNLYQKAKYYYNSMQYTKSTSKTKRFKKAKNKEMGKGISGQRETRRKQ